MNELLLVKPRLIMIKDVIWLRLGVLWMENLSLKSIEMVKLS